MKLLDPSQINNFLYQRHQKIFNDPQEYKHFGKILATFFNYKFDSKRDFDNMQKDFESIDKDDLKYMKFNYQDRINKLIKAADMNFNFLMNIVGQYHSILGLTVVNNQISLKSFLL